MPWCPKCKIEYVEGIKTCSDCHVNLVDELGEDDYAGKYDVGEPELIVTVEGESEANRIEALLTSNQIPVMRKYAGSGEAVKLITGNTSFGIELYVPSKLTKKALTILQREDDMENTVIVDETAEVFEDMQDETCGSGQQDYNPEILGKNHNLLKSVILALVAIAAVVVLIYVKGAS